MKGGNELAIVGGTQLAVVQLGSGVEKGRVVIFQGGYLDPANTLRTCVFDGIKESIVAWLVVPRAGCAPTLRRSECQKKHEA